MGCYERRAQVLVSEYVQVDFAWWRGREDLAPHTKRREIEVWLLCRLGQQQRVVTGQLALHQVCSLRAVNPTPPCPRSWLQSVPGETCDLYGQAQALSHCHTTVKSFDKNGKMEDNDAVRALGALAQPHRLRTFRALVVAGREGLTPGDISGQLDIPPATLSFHLKELAFAGMVSQTRDGRNLIYRASFERMNSLLAFLTSNCCEGQPCELEAPSCNC